MIDKIQHWLPFIVALGWAACNEFMALNPNIKSNSLFQAFFKILGFMKEKDPVVPSDAPKA